MELFRGDTIFNDKTRPELYRNNGLRTKAFGGNCNPQNIEILGLLESIRKHIRPESQLDNNYFNVTDYLSFSENNDRAKYWCSNKNKLTLEKAANFCETRYLFKFNLDNKDIIKHGSGIYSYSYCCNPRLKSSDYGLEPQESILKHIYSNEICTICENTKKKHRLLLINSYEYLQNNKSHSKYQGAIELTQQDKEWLILPFDPSGIHLFTRIPRADFWHVEHFIAIGEKRPKINNI